MNLVEHMNSWPPIIPASPPFTLDNVTMIDPSASATSEFDEHLLNGRVTRFTDAI
jgi:hypothetical protein